MRSCRVATRLPTHKNTRVCLLPVSSKANAGFLSLSSVRRSAPDGLRLPGFPVSLGLLASAAEVASPELAAKGGKKASCPSARSASLPPDALCLPTAALESPSLLPMASQNTTNIHLSSTSTAPAEGAPDALHLPHQASPARDERDPVSVPIVEPEADGLDLRPYISESVMHMDAMDSHRFRTLLGRNHLGSEDIRAHLEGQGLMRCGLAV
ncbi:hypothetical protein Efla_001345 [Eimeria flavescens]